MVWISPRTWTDGEVVTAALFNSYLRDNQLVLKTTRNAAGRLSGLSSATLADLSSANVTGVAKPGGANSFTAGTTQMTGTARVVLPVGADKYEDLGGGLRRGFWVEGNYLHHIGSNQTTEWRYLGAVVSTPSGAISGSAWIEGDYLHYIDASGVERRCSSTTGGHTDAAAIAGSCWVETYVHWIREAGGYEVPGHADIAHADGTEHSDGHTDVAHSDNHSDTGHADSHADEAHTDSHSDTHNDNYQDHSDDFHQDKHTDNHGDTHVDTSHTDTHTDTAHGDGHSDTHTDTHDDHNDHGDVQAQNQPTVVV